MDSHHAHSEIKVGSERSFGYVFAVAFSLLTFVPLLHGGSPVYWLLGVGAAFLVVTLVRPSILRPLNILWFKFGMLLAKIVQPIVMAAVFFLVVAPIGLLMRAFGKDLLHKKMGPGIPSYWQERDPERNRMGSMKDQF